MRRVCVGISANAIKNAYGVSAPVRKALNHRLGVITARNLGKSGGLEKVDPTRQEIMIILYQ
jgi:hypothetical protein